jgi:hypothetical protein
MSTLNQIELAMLTRAALNQKPKTTSAEYKRRSRARAVARSQGGKIAFNSETMNRALLSALASLVQSGNLNEPISTVLQIASEQFGIPAVAEIAIRTRLATRKPTQASGGPSNE